MRDALLNVLAGAVGGAITIYVRENWRIWRVRWRMRGRKPNGPIQTKDMSDMLAAVEVRENSLIPYGIIITPKIDWLRMTDQDIK